MAAPTSLQGATVASTSFPHGFGDSCYFQGIFTTNSGSTWNDFGAQTPNLAAPNPQFQTVDVEAYSDGTNLYVQAVNYYDVAHSTSSAYTVNYKVYALAKNTMAAKITPGATNAKLYYNSNYNFQKIFSKSNVGISVSGGSSGSSATITHSLGYIPKVRAFFVDGSNEVFALNQWKPLVTGGTWQTVPAIEAHMTTTTLIFFYDGTGLGAPTLSGTIEYRIYLDS